MSKSLSPRFVHGEASGYRTSQKNPFQKVPILKGCIYKDNTCINTAATVAVGLLDGRRQNMEIFQVATPGLR